jgi:hypothetical protein
MASFEEIRQELEWRRCKKDPEYFFGKYWRVAHPERGAIPFELREAQRETLKVWLEERMSIALKARQIGFSTLAAGLAFHDVFFHDSRKVIGLSKTERDAWKLMEKSAYGYQRMPEWLRSRGPNLLQKSLGKMAFDNDSSFECLPSVDPARGEAAYRIFADEWAHFPNPEDAWAAIEPAADIGGRVAALSSAKGVGNLFHTMWIGATTGTNEFKPIFFNWRSVPERDDNWYAAKKRSMPEWTLHQEYPNTPEEAFIKSGNPVFDVDELGRTYTEDPYRGFLQSSGPRNAEFNPSDGPLCIWEMPQRRKYEDGVLVPVRYVIGADVAEGLEYGDFSSAHVINTATGKVAAKWRGHVDPDLFGSEILWYLGHFYNHAFIGVEVNNHGLTTLTALNNKGYGSLYYRHAYDERTKKRTRKLGWRTQINTKPLMIDELARDLRVGRDEEGEIVEEASLTLLDSETIGELKTFVRDENGKTHGSPFDDQVISLAIANQMLKHAATQAHEVEKDDEGTFNWWVRLALKADEQPEWTIGNRNVRQPA